MIQRSLVRDATGNPLGSISSFVSISATFPSAGITDEGSSDSIEDGASVAGEETLREVAGRRSSQPGLRAKLLSQER